MNSDQLKDAILRATIAAEIYKKSLNESSTKPDPDEIRNLLRLTEGFLTEMRILGAAGRPCPACGGSGRVSG